MARQRASQARDAFARVGIAQVGPAEDDSASDLASEIASTGASHVASIGASIPASVSASEKASQNAGTAASPIASVPASRTASAAASTGAGRARRTGRPQGPARVPLSIRILAANDARLTAAVSLTGQSPQYVVDTALAAYFDALGIPRGDR